MCEDWQLHHLFTAKHCSVKQLGHAAMLISISADDEPRNMNATQRRSFLRRKWLNSHPESSRLISHGRLGNSESIHLTRSPPVLADTSTNTQAHMSTQSFTRTQRNARSCKYTNASEWGKHETNISYLRRCQFKTLNMQSNVITIIMIMIKVSCIAPYP